MGLLHLKIRDDRGVVRPVYGTGYGVAPQTDAQTLSDEEFWRIRGRAERAYWTPKENPRYVPLKWHEAILRASMETAVFGLLSVGLLALLRRRGFAKVGVPVSVAEAMLAEKRCPSCAYSLTGTVAPADSCVVCSKCGGAWRLPERPCSFCGHDLSRDRVLKDGSICCATCAKYTPEA